MSSVDKVEPFITEDGRAWLGLLCTFCIVTGVMLGLAIGRHEAAYLVPVALCAAGAAVSLAGLLRSAGARG